MTSKIKYLNLRDIINIISDVQNAVKLHITPDGIYLICIDISNVMLLNMNIPKELFEYYNMCDQTINVNIDKLKLFCDISYGYISIKQNVVDNTLTFKSGNYTYEANSMADNLLKKEPNYPKLSFNAKTTIPVANLKKFLLKTKSISNSVKLTINNIKTTFEVIDTDTLSCEFESGMIDDELEYNSPHSYYTIGYLDIIRKLKGNIDISMSTEHPCRIDFDIDNIKCGHILLAPRIETNDNKSYS